MEDKDLREENLQEEAAEMQAEAEVTEAVEAEVVDETEAKMAELEQKAADYLDKYQRCLAEFDNFRKRTSKEKPWAKNSTPISMRLWHMKMMMLTAKTKSFWKC